MELDKALLHPWLAECHQQRLHGTTKEREATASPHSSSQALPDVSMAGPSVASAMVVDEDGAALERAKGAGLVTVRGSASNSDVLRLASAQHADTIIVAANRDDTAVLVTLTARELAPKAKIIAAVREAENQHLLQQSGADTTVVTSETAGRLLGIAKKTPTVVEVMEDLDAFFAGDCFALLLHFERAFQKVSPISRPLSVRISPLLRPNCCRPAQICENLSK